VKKNWILLTLVFVLLLVGWSLFRLLNPGGSLAIMDPGFRDWFWEQRALDLAVQIVLVFAGALGIAAILPVEDEDD